MVNRVQIPTFRAFALRGSQREWLEMAGNVGMHGVTPHLLIQCNRVGMLINRQDEKRDFMALQAELNPLNFGLK